jgi:O-acetylserine/cysteine efflux transporter
VKPIDYAAAIVAAVVWGLTFIAIKFGVEEAPPFLLTALRFAFAAFPLVLFVRPPKAPAQWVALYGLLIGVGQFGLIFLAVQLGMPVGLASLVIMTQVYFTILFAVVFFGERPTRAQAIGAGVSLAGLGVIGYARSGHANFLPFLLTLGAALCWGSGNIVGKKIGRVDPIALVVWSSLVAPAPMFALSYWVTPERTISALLHPSLTLALSVAGLAYGGTLISYGLWSRLLARHPAAAVTPFALLVPVVAMISARLLFNEATSATELLGAALVMSGLAINVAGARVGAFWAYAGGGLAPRLRPPSS